MSKIYLINRNEIYIFSLTQSKNKTKKKKQLKSLNSINFFLIILSIYEAFHEDVPLRT